MGPRHNTQPLSAVLADPLLSTVVTEVGDAQAAGWFWNIRPLHVKVHVWVGEWVLSPDV